MKCAARSGGSEKTPRRFGRRARLATLIALAGTILDGCVGQPADPADSDQDDVITPAAMLIQVPNAQSGDNPTYELLARSAPAAGLSVSDSRLGTTQRRVVRAEGLRHEYSRHDPFNVDGSLILLLHVSSGEWRVYRTNSVPYDDSANLLRTVAIEEPRWDPVDPALLWGFQEFRILTVDVQTGATAVVKDFSADAAIAPLLAANADLYRITTRDEGEPSRDYRYWALLLQGSDDDYRARYLITWDRSADQVFAVHPLSAQAARIDWVGMSPLGTWVLVGGDYDNAPPLTGLTLADRALTQFHRLDYGVAHSDVGVDSTGREVIVMQNTQTDYIDLIPLGLDTQPILTAGGSYDGTGRVPLVRLYYDSGSPIGLNSSVHISCNRDGYCVVSTFTEPSLREQNWLDRTITLVRLDPANPRAFYLGKVYGTSGAYWEETHASISRDGTRVVWATNWGRNVGDERVWLMQLNILPEWLESIEQ